MIVKSFAPVAVFDKEYDALGPFPAPPRLRTGEAARRTLIVYNDTFADDEVHVSSRAVQGDRAVASGQYQLVVPLGSHALREITFTAKTSGELRLELISAKGGREQFRDTRKFLVE